MTETDRIALSGAPGSPYTRKMLAVLRYRRIPYRFLLASVDGLAGMPKPKVQLLPTFYLPGPDGELEAVVDSSPIIRRLEKERAGRSVIPSDPALAFLDALIEDYADEWLTKAMFHYRWSYAEDIDKSARILPLWRGVSISGETHAAMAKAFAERQIGRLGVVGSNAVTGPVIEASYRRFIAAFEAHLTRQPFLLGRRPGACDFGVFGQLTQLAGFDPTPMAETLKAAPRVFAWVGMMEDLSGLEPAEGDWTPIEAIPETLTALLAEIGRVYAPVMLANARALMGRAEAVQATVDGQAWTQAPFPYQGKCVQWLREGRAGLGDDARAAVDRALAGTGCEALFA
ncbi:glutathione S-transferase N-terminal domain-containing protein [Phenylobacterium montanum]|uniref:Glutathione S-transferase n=1 Tax=Phenylobacterium montanum TaxID=2823693 RepID=A0A975IU15_9CAUL|nr:glutathione S-transferase N-terminal domain-containing protein [Caulobacter sp. S6]QUD87467.1 glutathione S-transferase [Caulobacter sp. S6]